MAAVDPRWEANQRVAQAASGSANELVPALERIVLSGDWREFPHPMRGMQRYERLADYCQGFLGLTVEAVEALLERSNFPAAVRVVRREIREAIPAAAKQGRPKSDQVKGSSTTFPGRGETYTLGRLKRDRPDLAAQVVEGSLSAHAAALRAGFRHPRVSVRTDDANAAVRVLLKHYTAQELVAALAVPA